MKPIFLVCGFLLMSFVPLQGQTTPGSENAPQKAETSAAPAVEKKVDPVKEADIRKLLDLLGTPIIMRQTMQTMEASIKPMMEKSLPPGEYRQTLVDMFFERFQSKLNTQKLVELAIPVYDKYFSDEDIKGMIQFYQTPLGQKTIKALPQLTAELAAAGQKMGADVARQSMLEVLAEHPELEKAMEDAQR